MRRATLAGGLLAVAVLQGCAAAGTTTTSAPPAATTAPTSTATVSNPQASVMTPTAVPTPSASASPSAATDCVTASIDYPQGAKGTQGDPTSIARAALVGLLPSDQLSTSTDDRGAQMVKVLRGGLQVAELQYDPAGDGGWLLVTANMCNGLRLR